MSVSQFIQADFSSDLIPKPVEYAVLLPAEYEEAEEPTPLIYFLHGGGGSRSFLAVMEPLLQRLWDEGQLPKLVAVTPSAGRSFYMDCRDGSHNWEQLLIGPFLSHMRESYRVQQDRKGLFVAGVSMGGMGALRLGLKYPELFAGVAALEPGIEPVMAFKDIQFEDRFWRSDELFESIFGKPVDEEYWALNNPANIAIRNAEQIRSSGLGVYLECGDEDAFGLDRGTEFRAIMGYRTSTTWFAERIIWVRHWEDGYGKHFSS